MLKWERYSYNQRGLTLIEVVASLLITTLILLSFAGLIIQSNKIGKSSENIVESTYVGQSEMERIYNINKTLKKNTFSNATEANIIKNIKEQLIVDFTSLGYSPDLSNTLGLSFKKPLDNQHIELTVKDKTIKLETETKVAVVGVVIRIYEKNIIKAQMENSFLWKEENQ